MKIDLFHTGGCPKCAATLERLKSTAKQAVPGLVWCELDPQDDLDYAVDLGVLTLPALAIDGKLVFSSLPTEAQLVDALRQHALKES